MVFTAEKISHLMKKPKHIVRAFECQHFSKGNKMFQQFISIPLNILNVSKCFIPGFSLNCFIILTWTDHQCNVFCCLVAMKHTDIQVKCFDLIKRKYFEGPINSTVYILLLEELHCQRVFILIVIFSWIVVGFLKGFLIYIYLYIFKTFIFIYIYIYIYE